MSDGSGIEGKGGNGSKGVAWIKPYAYQFKGKAGVSAGINKLVITDLVSYSADDTALDDDLEEAL